MAAANMKAVKLRIKSVQNTMQITKAMQLVAASKLRRAKDKAMSSKPYLRIMKRTLTKMASLYRHRRRQGTRGRLQRQPV